MKRKKKLLKHIQKKLNKLEDTTEYDLSDRLDDNESILKQAFSNCTDLVVRKLYVRDSIPCMLAYLEVLVDGNQLDKNLLEPLMKHELEDIDHSVQSIEMLRGKLVPITKANIIGNLQEITQSIVKGEVVIFVESSQQAISVSIKDQLHREPDEPSTEAVIRGPRLGFIENLSVNMALIRHLIRTPQLKMEKVTKGTISHTDVVITYIENIAPRDVIQEVKKRIAKINMDGVLESGYIEEMISDQPYSPFPTIQSTQRPDSVSASLIEGKVAILLDGSPMALILPITFWHGFQTVEDYYMNFIFATMLRWLRYLFAFLAMALPSIYIAITTFHQEMVPTSLALSLAAAREVVPFPAVVETLVMEIVFEALREAGVRLPRPVGQTISIVGALVIGESAVQAGIISAPIVIVVSLTGIASFLIPHPDMGQAISILRFPMIILAGTFGLYGVSAALITILIHLVNLRSFGVPYMAPLAPLNLSGLSDILVRAPWKFMHKRGQDRRRKLGLERE